MLTAEQLSILNHFPSEIASAGLESIWSQESQLQIPIGELLMNVGWCCSLRIRSNTAGITINPRLV